MHNVSLGPFVVRFVGSTRWLAVWFVLCGLKATLVPHCNNGPPIFWSGPPRVAMEIYLAREDSFGWPYSGMRLALAPTDTGCVFIGPMNSTVWLIFVYATIWILGRLRVGR